MRQGLGEAQQGRVVGPVRDVEAGTVLKPVGVRHSAGARRRQHRRWNQLPRSTRLISNMPVVCCRLVGAEKAQKIVSCHGGLVTRYQASVLAGGTLRHRCRGRPMTNVVGGGDYLSRRRGNGRDVRRAAPRSSSTLPLVLIDEGVQTAAVVVGIDRQPEVLPSRTLASSIRSEVGLHARRWCRYTFPSCD